MPSTSPSVVLNDVSFAWPDGERAVDHLTAAFGSIGAGAGPGRRVGLVGRNGAGKTTLVRLVSGDLVPTSGTVTTAGAVDFLPQRIAVGPDDTVADLLGVRGRLDALRSILAGDAGTEHFDVLDDDWEVESRALAAIESIGLTGVGGGDPLDRLVATLSGGQAVLVAVAGIRLRGRPVAFLDEPTNNLDRAARAALLETVDSWRGTLVLVSHDRELLEHVDEVVELRDGTATVFGGTYSAFEEHLAVQQAAVGREVRAAEQQYRTERRQRIETETRIARRAKVGAKKAQSMPRMFANEMRKRAEQSAGASRVAMRGAEDQARAAVEDAEGRLRDDESIHVTLPDPAVPASRRIAEITVRGRTTIVQGPERVAVAGPNGVGKTTLLEQLVGVPDAREHPLPDTGARATTDRIAYLPQRRDQLDDDASVLDNLRRSAPDVPPAELRNQLARFLVRGRAVERPAGSLSGGERFRVALAGLLLADPPPQLLVLDEPTNDLDLSSTDRIVEALHGYRGAIVVVSHDDTFLDRLAITSRIDLA